MKPSERCFTSGDHFPHFDIILKENAMSANSRFIAVARREDGIDAFHRQVRALTRLAITHGIRVVGSITLPFCSASDYEVESHVAVLIGRRRGRDDFGMFLVTDLSRLSARGLLPATSLIRKLAIAGVAVVTPELGVIDGKLRRAIIQGGEVLHPIRPCDGKKEAGRSTHQEEDNISKRRRMSRSGGVPRVNSKLW